MDGGGHGCGDGWDNLEGSQPMTPTDSRVRIFDRTGAPLVEILTKVTRSWELNTWGEASFKMTYNDPKWREKFFQFGNLLLIETNNLPIWGGVIDNARSWGKFEATVRAYSGEYLFALRAFMSPYDETHNAGDHFGRWIALANHNEDTLIDPGVIWGGGSSFSFPEAYVKIGDAIKDLLEKSGNDYSVIPYLDDHGYLKFYGHWYEKRLSFRKTPLREGHNLEVNEKSLVEYPPKANYVVAFGNAALIAEKSTHEAQNVSSRGKYGTRQDGISVNSNEQADVTAAAHAAIKLDGDKQNIFSDLTALNIGSTFSDLDIGNVLPIQFIQYGFGLETRGRIVYMQTTDGVEEVKLVCEEYVE
jgi:hypothetical protein